MVNVVKYNLSASLEDYLEVIYNLSCGQNKVARCKDIADELRVARSSVTGALKQLAERDLVNYKPYGYVTLTKAGTAAAEWIVRKHNILATFFVDVLGVSHKEADDAACRVEHALGQTVISKIIGFCDYIEHKKIHGSDIVQEFRDFGLEE